ncbi:hypothetical protein GCM10010300_48270 [Streptomyces olivaceoviridis]|uniref:hypothetical protein n=1 Tax=Streptomyces olivaceoviridis TaxID=1921 RepID=UPI0016738BEB|nr:hypothetical protein [Streptomyces olivaceoviridis]GGY98501.1 hypothetical protein GCM10010300_48270 [Streptomyces olivaceoviridis]
MTGHTDEPAERFDRARDEEEPGAHSGSESRARDRTVPGTAGAKEGYQPEEGTAAGEPLRGVRAEERPEERRQGDEEAGSGR